MQQAKVARPQIDVRLTVNGREHELRIEPRQTLAEILRGPLALTGTKVSCDSQVCGTCTVLVDGLTVSSCTYLAADADGRDVRTVEGMANPETGELTVLQQSFIDYAAFQSFSAGVLVNIFGDGIFDRYGVVLYANVQRAGDRLSLIADLLHFKLRIRHPQTATQSYLDYRCRFAITNDRKM